MASHRPARPVPLSWAVIVLWPLSAPASVPGVESMHFKDGLLELGPRSRGLYRAPAHSEQVADWPLTPPPLSQLEAEQKASPSPGGLVFPVPQRWGRCWPLVPVLLVARLGWVPHRLPPTFPLAPQCPVQTCGVVGHQATWRKNRPTMQENHGFDPWVGKTLWRREWQPTPVFLPGESHGQ